MTRHGRNATAHSVYSYHEKKKDQQAAGFGTLKTRITKHGLKDFDCCSLTLQPCRHPVVTQQILNLVTTISHFMEGGVARIIQALEDIRDHLDGYLYDKEAILEYILKKKRDIARQTKAFEKQKSRDQRDLAELGEAEKRDEAAKLLKDAATTTPVAGPSSLSNMHQGQAKALPSFWVPTLTPNSAKEAVKKPEPQVVCPMSGNPLKVKDLIDIHFTLIGDKEDEKKALIARERRYKCPITHDVLSNAVPAVVIRPTGAVVTEECVNKLIRPDMIDPLTGKKLTDKDLIPLQRGGTGYAGANADALEGKHARPVMQAY